MNLKNMNINTLINDSDWKKFLIKKTDKQTKYLFDAIKISKLAILDHLSLYVFIKNKFFFSNLIIKHVMEKKQKSRYEIDSFFVLILKQ